MSRAERFEDEKRRIIESCFSKVDQSGQLAESYITHIRIHEDAAHPSTPPPPDSSDSNKKPRLIIIAVRSTGRVRMHKARENNNGSFSIGKTWNMEEMSAIESFNSPLPPQTEREAQYRQWAGSTGFIVTITKPYYWQAGTAKEKEFFIASAVKIYRKYTKGQVPELRGFDDQQKASMTGVPPGQQPPPPQAVPMPQAPPDPLPAPAPPQPPFAARPQSRDNSQYRGSPGPPPSVSDRDYRAPSVSSNRHPSEGRQPSDSSARYGTSPTPPVPKPFASSEHLRSNSRDAYRQDSRPGTSPGQGGYRSPIPPAGQMPQPPSHQSSHTNLRTESPANLSISSGGPSYRSQSPNRDPRYQQSMDSFQDERRMGRSPPPSGTNGGEIFPPPQQRFQQQQQQRPQSPLAPRQPPPVSPQQRTVSPVPPQLPPLETTYSNNKEHNRNQTADSELSSAGFDPAALASLTGFQGPEHSFATAPPPSIEEPSSPPTPEKSRKRQGVDYNRTNSNTSDLRPAPLTQRNKTQENGSAYATPSEGTPRHEEPPPELKPQPLSPTKGKPEGNLQMPGGFQATPGPSPAETPQEEKKEEPQTEDVASPDEEFRPGLGPMIKKRVVADRFKKAANAASAFKPRPGGAAEKILKAKAEREANTPVEPDGITSVVPRPTTATKQEEPTQAQAEDLSVKAPPKDEAPKIDVSSPMSPARGFDADMDGAAGVQLHDEQPTLQTPDQQARQEEVEAAEKERHEQRAMRKPQVKVKRRSAGQDQQIAALGIDPALLKDRCLEFEAMIEDFGWKDASLSAKALNDMESSLRKEQARLEAGTWLANPEHDAGLQDKVANVDKLLDKAIEECDDMDKLLTIYSMELGTLNEDVAYIEAQSQGLQVQAANQRLLHQELSQLLDTISLDKRVLEPLRRSDLSDNIGVEETEHSLAKLYQAMITIDPNIRSTSSGRPKSKAGMNEGMEMSSMAALRQKRDVFERESNGFCQRLMQHLDYTFSGTFGSAQNRVMRPASGTGATRINTDAFYEARKGLWVFSPLILFTKELNTPAWQTILRMYHSHAKQMYQNPFKQNFSGWKAAARKPTGEELEILFTATEKDEAQDKGALSSARKLTVKRSQTLAKTLRNASGGDKTGSNDSRSSGSMMYCEVFAGAMDEMAPLLNQEQNFIVDFLHATSLESADFLDAISAHPPENRYGTNLIEKKPTEPDREMARRITSTMDELFGFMKGEFNSLVDWSVSLDPIQGVGVMACLSRHAYYLADSNQEFLLQLIEALTARLQNLFSKFVDEQVRAIEDTKVKIKKRKGVIAFMKTFPHFSAGVENVFAVVGGNDYDVQAECLGDVRLRVDDAYARINRAMFDSLKVIAKEGPTAPGANQPHGDDSQQEKEMLNYEVLIIENMNHYVEEVDDGGKEGVLAEWRGRAMIERAEAMEAYVARVIRRPLGKLLVGLCLSLSFHASKANYTCTGLPRLNRNPQILAPQQPSGRHQPTELLPQSRAQHPVQLRRQGDPAWYCQATRTDHQTLQL